VIGREVHSSQGSTAVILSSKCSEEYMTFTRLRQFEFELALYSQPSAPVTLQI
jgi:hypothetical protein